MLDSKTLAGSSEVAGAVGSAAVGEDALDGNAVSLVEVRCLVESGYDALDLLVGKQAGEGEAGVIIDGDVQAFDAGTAVAQGAIAGGADTRALEAAQLLDVEVEELAWMSALVALDWGFWWLEGGETMEAMATKDA